MSTSEWCYDASSIFGFFGLLVSFSSTMIAFCCKRRKQESTENETPALPLPLPPKVEQTLRMSLRCPDNSSSEFRFKKAFHFRKRKEGPLEESSTQKYSGSTNVKIVEEKMVCSETQKTLLSEKQGRNNDAKKEYSTGRSEGLRAKDGNMKKQEAEPSKTITYTASKLEATQCDDSNLQPEITIASTKGITAGASNVPTPKEDREEKKRTLDADGSKETASTGCKLEATQCEEVNVQPDIKLESTQEDIEGLPRRGKLKVAQSEGSDQLAVEHTQELDSVRSNQTQMSSISEQKSSNEEAQSEGESPAKRKNSDASTVSSSSVRKMKIGVGK